NINQPTIGRSNDETNQLSAVAERRAAAEQWSTTACRDCGSRNSRADSRIIAKRGGAPGDNIRSGEPPGWACLYLPRFSGQDGWRIWRDALPTAAQAGPVLDSRAVRPEDKIGR